MKNFLNFLIEVCKLKEMPRTGWVLRGVIDPETVAEHTFGVAMFVWLLGEKNNLNIKRAIKIALSHDLCEVYAGDATPFFYYPKLPKNKEERREMLMKWTRLSKKEKGKIGKAKFEKEKKALLKLIKSLRPEIKKEIFSFWLDYENGLTKEGRFVRQLNRIETLIQSINFFGTEIVKSGSGWWEWVEEIVDDPLLLEFLNVIQNRFYGKLAGYKKNQELENILDFLLEIGKLKKMPRLYWIMRGVKKPETVAGHIFTLALMAWLFGSERKNLSLEKLLKMALCHEITAIGTGDTTPYDDILPEDKRERREILEKWPRFLKNEKTKKFLKDYQEEKRAIEKVTLGLTPSLKKEIFQFWKEYRTRTNHEGHFLSQLNVLAVLLQNLLYRKKDKKFFAGPIWEWAFEICDNPLTIALMEEMKKKFY